MADAPYSLTSDSPSAVRGAELARELLTARADAYLSGGDVSLFSDALHRALTEVAGDEELLANLLAALPLLGWLALLQSAAVAVRLGHVPAELHDESAHDQLRQLIASSTARALTI